MRLETGERLGKWFVLSILKAPLDNDVSRFSLWNFGIGEKEILFCAGGCKKKTFFMRRARGLVAAVGYKRGGGN